MQYNLSNEIVRKTVEVEQNKPFPGRNTEQMPLLLGELMSPWSAARFMRRRIDHADDSLI